MKNEKSLRPEKSVDWKNLEVRLHPSNFGISRTIGKKSYQDRVRDFDLWFISSGQTILEFQDGQKVLLRRGVVTVFRPGEAFFSSKLNEQEPLDVHFFHFNLHRKGSRKNLTGESPELRNLPRHGEVIEVHFFEACCRKINSLNRDLWQSEESLEETAREQANLLFRNLLVEFDMSHRLQAHGQPSGLHLEHFRQVSELIGKIYESPEKYHSVAAIARDQGYSADHYTKIVRAITGRHLKQVIIDARMERAKQLLLHSTSTLEVIAHELGYAEVFYFLRQFKEQTKMTPSAFRRGGRQLG